MRWCGRQEEAYATAKDSWEEQTVSNPTSKSDSTQLTEKTSFTCRVPFGVNLTSTSGWEGNSVGTAEREQGRERWRERERGGREGGRVGGRGREGVREQKKEKEYVNE